MNKWKPNPNWVKLVLGKFLKHFTIITKKVPNGKE